jgi:GxxExxY protein
VAPGNYTSISSMRMQLVPRRLLEAATANYHHAMERSQRCVLRADSYRELKHNRQDLMPDKRITLTSSRQESVEHATYSYPSVPSISDVASLDNPLTEICSNIFRAVGSRQREKTYHECLIVDLQIAGITSVKSEVDIPLYYKGKKVGSRRSDLILKTLNDMQRVILEIKAVQALNAEHLEQLQYYMYLSNIDVGYLINFPTDIGYPLPGLPVAVSALQEKQGEDSDNHNNVLVYFHREIISGSTANARALTRPTSQWNSCAPVQIIRVNRDRNGCSVVQQHERLSPSIPRATNPYWHYNV